MDHHRSLFEGSARTSNLNLVEETLVPPCELGRVVARKDSQSNMLPIGTFKQVLVHGCISIWNSVTTVASIRHIKPSWF